MAYLENVGVPVFHETCTNDLQKVAHEFCEALKSAHAQRPHFKETWKCCDSIVEVVLSSMLEIHQEDCLKSMLELSP